MDDNLQLAGDLYKTVFDAGQGACYQAILFHFVCKAVAFSLLRKYLLGLLPVVFLVLRSTGDLFVREHKQSFCEHFLGKALSSKDHKQ